MQKDFHYYCIGVLAKAAGFNVNDALTIAYASQYVDDSTESKPIRSSEHNIIFDPVRTAHIGLKAYEWSVQKRVYIPFHFIPAKPIRFADDSYVTEPDSDFAQLILEEACKEKPGLFRLCRIGVALHTYADTWAHQGFSGREHRENDVESIHIYQNDDEEHENDWKRLIWENLYLDLLPQIGHAEAGYFPDQPFQIWKCKMGATDEEIARENPKEFLTAAESIYKKLREADKSEPDTPIPWGNIKTEIENMLKNSEDDIKERCKKWKGQFQHMFEPLKFEYDKLAWRENALKPIGRNASTNWDKYEPSKFRNINFSMKPGFYESPWLHFHRAALRQRHIVLENLL